MKKHNRPRFPETPQSSARSWRALLVLVCLIALAAGIKLWSGGLLPVGAAAQDPPKSPDGLWQEMTETPEMLRQERQIKPDSYRTLRLNQQAMRRLLDQAPMEFSAAAKQAKVIVTIPLPDGKFGRFRIEESPIMAPELAAKFPEIKTYSAQGLDDPAATARLDWTPAGFHAMILSVNGSVYVDPYAKGDTANYISYYKRDYQKEGDTFRCFVSGEDVGPRRPFNPLAPAVVPPNGMTLRTYRLALAANVEYTQAAGGTVPLAMARMTTTMNRVNGVFEREIAVRMVMIPNNDDLIYLAEPDPYTNNNSSALLNENQANVDNVIGTANYDVGHVFTTGSGGRARLNSPCDPNNKARGTTGRPNPIGDSFDIDFVAHEFGHQFGANHTFNEDVSGSCGGGARAEEAAYEPASGTTIMAYAGICTPQNLQPNSNDYFHVKSLEEMIAHITGEGNCAAQTATQNTPPVANAGASFTIPRNTPFTLTATATDANGDALTYDWEEFDLGAAAPPNNDADGQARPIFRSYSPLTSGARTFPSLQYILNNANVPPGTYNCGGPNCITGEVLPAIGRTMNFQATVRDNRAGGGGVNSAAMQVTVVAATGPFQVTAPNTAVNWTGGGQQTVTWAVNGTNAAPISAANVKISLSTDGGLTFPIVIANSTPNDGNQTITVPNVNTTMGRIKVEAVGNIFFDISDANITIASVCTAIAINPPQLPNGAVNVAYNQTLTGSGGNAPYTFTLDAGLSTTTRFDASGPVNIPDNNPAGIDLPVNISGISSSISKVTVSLQIAHTYVRDLRLQLIGPDATTIDLAVNRGPDAATTGYGLACNPDASRTTFDDAAVTLIANATPPFAGTFKPDQLLAAFNGKSGAAVNGQWKLHVIDNAGQDTGTINCVSISITQTQPAPGLSLAANGTLSGIPTTAGTYNFTVKATDAGNCMGTQAYALTIDAVSVCPTVNNLNPANGPIGSSVTITGTNFTGVTAVKFSNNVTATITNNTGTQLMVMVPAGAVTGPITISKTGCGDVQTASFTVNGNGLQFYPLPSPVRLLDTRSGVTGCVTNVGTLAAGSTRTEPARTACSTIPAGATAIIGNITVVPTGPGFLTLYPSDATQPTVANSNFTAGEVTNNFFTVGLGTTGLDAGAFKIFTSATTHVIIDLTGYYAPPGAGGLYYHPLPSPVRLVQTFPGQTGCFLNGSQQLVGQNNPNANPALDLTVDGRGAGLPSPCNSIPGDAVVLVGNATTVFPNAPFGSGYLTIYPSDATRPTVASSNYGNNDIINGPFAVKLGADGKFKVYTFSTTHLVIDISGYYSASANDANGAGLLFNPLPKPMRLLETRADFPGFPLTGCYRPNAPIPDGTGGIRTQQVWGTCSDQPITIPNAARAIAGNVTVINPTGAGFGTFFPGNVGTAPTVATTNYPFPVTFGYNRHYYVGLGPADGTFKILTQFTSNYIVDVSGYFAP